MPQISFRQTLVGGTASGGCDRKLGLTWTVDWSIIVGLGPTGGSLEERMEGLGGWGGWNQFWNEHGS